MNLEISRGAISRDLPFVRSIGLGLLNADYETSEQALNSIEVGMEGFYADRYPDRAAELATKIATATEALQRVYENNFFPEYNTDYRARVNNLSHFVNDGCFRCHNSELQSETGATISADCESCHSIVAQGPTDDLSSLDDDLSGLPFQHPADIGGVWQTVKCTQCHNPASGY